MVSHGERKQRSGAKWRAALTGRRRSAVLPSAYEVEPIVLGQDLHAEFFSLFEFRSRAGAGHDVGRAFRDRARHFCAEPFGLRFGLVARQPFELAGEHDGRARELQTRPHRT